jgi:molybdopterin-binding protein
MKLSARNVLKGTIDKVQKGQTTAHVRINVGGAIITASITNEGGGRVEAQGRSERLRGGQGLGRDGWDRRDVMRAD